MGETHGPESWICLGCSTPAGSNVLAWASGDRRFHSLCPPCLSCFNTEHTERLSDLCVGALLATEDRETRTGWCRAEALTTRGQIFAAREEADCLTCEDFGSCKICGEGPYPKAFLFSGQPAKGESV